MHGGYMRVAVKSPGKPWDAMWVENKPGTLAHVLGGEIKNVSTFVTGENGTIIAIGVDGDEFTDLPDEIMGELVG